MKISLNWQVLGVLASSIKIESILTETGLEVDDIIKINPDIKSLENLVVGEVISITNHKNADKLKVTRINIDSEELSIICGAKNIKISQKVVVAKIGTEIKKIKCN